MLKQDNTVWCLLLIGSHRETQENSSPEWWVINAWCIIKYHNGVSQLIQLMSFKFIEFVLTFV